MKPFLLGIPFDNGIRMMQRMGRGITGAADTPVALFRQLGNFKAEKKLLDLNPYQIRVTPENCNDPVAIQRDNTLTLEAHKTISKAMEAICRQGFFPVSVGGDHSITYPLVLGLCRAFPNKKFGLIYLDAHLDMRPLEAHAGVSGLVSSGNAFRRIIEDNQLPIEGRHIVAIGVHRSTSAIYMEMQQFALEKGMTIFEDRECLNEDPTSIIRKAVGAAGNETDGIYLSLDIDAVNARNAPGVSAPSESGLSRKVWLRLIEGIAEEANLVGIDLAEASSRQKSWQEVKNGKPAPGASPDSFKRTLQLLKQTLEVILRVRSEGC